MQNIDRILANLNVLRCIRKRDGKGWSMSGYMSAISNMKYVMRTKKKHVTMDDLTSPPIAGATIMNHILMIEASGDDLPEVKRALEKSDATFETAYNEYKSLYRWGWLRRLVDLSTRVGRRRLL
jgi:hypothetical protein